MKSSVGKQIVLPDSLGVDALGLFSFVSCVDALNIPTSWFVLPFQNGNQALPSLSDSLRSLAAFAVLQSKLRQKIGYASPPFRSKLLIVLMTPID
jgi:hypothetical protein